MPAKTSKEAGILRYFRTTPLPVAEMVFGLVREALRERRAHAARFTKKAVKKQVAKKQVAKKTVAKPAAVPEAASVA